MKIYQKKQFFLHTFVKKSKKQVENDRLAFEMFMKWIIMIND